MNIYIYIFIYYKFGTVDFYKKKFKIGMLKGGFLFVFLNENLEV